MKKVLSFLVAGALALGLIGCSGDMHNDVDPATIPASIALASAPRLSAGGVAGAMQEWSVDTITWTTKDDDNCKYTYDFVANAEEIEWKVVSKKGNWNSGAYGGGADTVTDANVGKTVTLTYDNATGGNKNVKTSGLKVNKVYTITLEYNKGNYDCTVTASDKEKPVPFYLDAYFFKGSYGDGTLSESVSNLLRNPTVNEQTGEVEYKLEVVCTADIKADEKVKFGLGNVGGESKYTGADLKVGEDYKELTAGAANDNTVDMKTGASYIVYVKTTPEKKVFCKITELPVYVTLKVKITGLDKKLAGKTAIIGGTWDDWKLGWTSAWNGTKKVSELMNGKVDANGTVVCKYPTQLKYNKNQAVNLFVFGGYIGDEKDGDIAKADIAKEIKFGGQDIKVENAITTEEDAVWVIEVDMDAEEAKAKKEPPLANVIVTDLPEELNGVELYFTGNFNDWKNPGEKGTFKVVVTDGKIELKDIDITLKPSGDFAFEGKFAAAGWTRPEVTSDDTSGNVKVTMSASKPTLKGTYKSAKDHKDGGKVYICDWSVE
ncbi:MAG: hypothetical protein MR911_04520 [Spirochaetia bacterium]|nr:hypothetical protein [Spirochaetia bacterium]